MRRLATLGSASARQQSATLAAAPAAMEQVRGIKNQHRYRHARYKSVVKDRIHFSKSWYLFAGNNHERVHVTGHEKEATENFANYHYGKHDELANVYTSNLQDLPPVERINALLPQMKARWKVQDNNKGYDKVKLALQAAECFEDLGKSTKTGADDWPEDHQMHFEQAVKAVLFFAQRCSHDHPDAVAAMIRVASIADGVGADRLRNEALAAARRSAEDLDVAYAFAQPGRPADSLKAPKPPQALLRKMFIDSHPAPPTPVHPTLAVREIVPESSDANPVP
jgi:hypothetical protein